MAVRTLGLGRPPHVSQQIEPRVVDPGKADMSALTVDLGNAHIPLSDDATLYSQIHGKLVDIFFGL